MAEGYKGAIKQLGWDIMSDQQLTQTQKDEMQEIVDRLTIEWDRQNNKK